MAEGAYYGVSVEEAARILKLSPARVRELVESGELQSIKPAPSSVGELKVLVRAASNLQEPAPPEEALQGTTIRQDEPAPVGEVPETASQEQPQAPAKDETHDEFIEPPGAPAPDAEETPPAGQELSRGDDTAATGEPTAPSGWVGMQQAARALGMSPQTVRWHIEQGNLEAKPEGEGVNRSWLVSIDSLHALRDAWQAVREGPPSRHTPTDASAIVGYSLGNPIRELADRLAEEAARAAEYRVRLEITEKAESTLRTELDQERQRREEAERRRDAAEHERDELRRRLESRPEPREAPASPSPTQTTTRVAEPRPTTGGAQEQPQAASLPGRRRGRLWRRVFGR
jgi:hypothetical protein